NIDTILSRIEIGKGVGGRSTFRIESEMFPADSEQSPDWGGRRSHGGHFWHMNCEGPYRSLMSLQGQHNGPGLCIHRKVHNDGVIGPLGEGGEVSTERHFVTSGLCRAKT